MRPLRCVSGGRAVLVLCWSSRLSIFTQPLLAMARGHNMKQQSHTTNADAQQTDNPTPYEITSCIDNSGLVVPW